MSTLIYNGVSIDLVRTHEVAYQPVQDDGGTYLYTKVSISVSGVVNPKATNYVSQSGELIHFDGATPTESVQAIQHALAQPRGKLVYDSGGSPGNPLVSSPVDGYPCDCNNGPIPGPLRITRVDGTKAFHVSFSVETWVSRCPGDESSSEGDDPEALISNRYAQTHSVNETHYTSIHTVGQAFFRTDFLEKAAETADRYRHLLFPPVPRGFQRKSITVAVTPSRNALTYQITDVEKAFDLKNESGVVDCEASYQVSSMSTDAGMVGLMTLHTVNISAVGDKDSSNWELTKFCFRLAQSRLPIGDVTRGFLRQIAINQSLTSRHVSLVVTMMLNQAKNVKLGVLDENTLRQDAVFPDRGGANPGMPNRRGSAGTYANEALVSAWKVACEAVPLPYEGKYEPGDPEPYTSPGSPKVSVYETPDLPSVETKYSDATTSAAYTDYAISMSHDTVYSRMQVPLAGPAGDPDDSGGVAFEDDRPDCAFLTLARPMHRRTVKWTAERIAQLPDVPSPNTNDPNLVIIDIGQVKTEAPILLPDGQTFAYRVSGVYVFGLKKPPVILVQSPGSPGQDQGGLPMGQMPWITPFSSAMRMSAANFVSGFIEDIIQPAGPELPSPPPGTPF